MSSNIRRLYALQGPANSGKSQTLLRLFDLLQSAYPAMQTNFLHRSERDVAVTLRGVGPHVVGLETEGDTNSRLNRSLQAFRTARCNIIFCGCRTRGETLEWVEALRPVYDVQFIGKEPAASDHDKASRHTALALMRLAELRP